MKVWLVISQLVTFGLWVYIRSLSAPIEGFITGNWIVIAHLIVVTGLLGFSGSRIETFATLWVLGLPVIYNLVRYYHEFKKYEAVPRNERKGIVSSASRINQRSVDVACVVGAVAVLIFTLQHQNIAFSRWILLSLLPGVSLFLALLIEALHKSNRWRR